MTQEILQKPLIQQTFSLFRACAKALTILSLSSYVAVFSTVMTKEFLRQADYADKDSTAQNVPLRPAFLTEGKPRSGDLGVSFWNQKLKQQLASYSVRRGNFDETIRLAKESGPSTPAGFSKWLSYVEEAKKLGDPLLQAKTIGGSLRSLLLPDYERLQQKEDPRWILTPLEVFKNGKALSGDLAMAFYEMGTRLWGAENVWVATVYRDPQPSHHISIGRPLEEKGAVVLFKAKESWFVFNPAAPASFHEKPTPRDIEQNASIEPAESFFSRSGSLQAKDGIRNRLLLVFNEQLGVAFAKTVSFHPTPFGCVSLYRDAVP